MSLSFAFNFKTPMNLWSKRPPKLNLIRPFRCLPYIHVNQGKLNPKALNVVFLGYIMSTKGYKRSVRFLWYVRF